MVMEGSVWSSQKKRPWSSAKMSQALRYQLREPVAKAQPNNSLKWVTNSPTVGSLVLLLEIVRLRREFLEFLHL